MNQDESEYYYASRRERFLGIIIFLLLLFSFFVHLSAFVDVSLKNFQPEKVNQTEIKSKDLNLFYFHNYLFLFCLENVSVSNDNNKQFDDLIDLNMLAFFCILAHLIWTIVPIVALDQCCVLNNKSSCRIVLKLLICTCPLLLSSELSMVFVSQINFLKTNILLIIIKWFIFLAAILISFWTGILSDKNKWHGIHGGKIAPEFHLPLYMVEN